MMEKAGDPSSFINSHGPSLALIDLMRKSWPGAENSTVSELLQVISQDLTKGDSGGSMMPRLDDKLFAKILEKYPRTASHLHYGAELKVDPDATAYPWRNAAFCYHITLKMMERPFWNF